MIPKQLGILLQKSLKKNNLAFGKLNIGSIFASPFQKGF